MFFFLNGRCLCKRLFRFWSQNEAAVETVKWRIIQILTTVCCSLGSNVWVYSDSGIQFNSVQLSWIYPLCSTQLNWTYAATCIQFSWVEGMRYIQVQLSISNFPLKRFGDIFFLQNIQTTRQLQPSLRHLVVDSKIKWKRHLVRTQPPEDGLANSSSG